MLQAWAFTPLFTTPTWTPPVWDTAARWPFGCSSTAKNGAAMEMCSYTLTKTCYSQVVLAPCAYSTLFKQANTFLYEKKNTVQRIDNLGLQQMLRLLFSYLVTICSEDPWYNLMDYWFLGKMFAKRTKNNVDKNRGGSRITRGRGRQPSRRGRQHTNLPDFPKKTAWN